LTYNLLVIVLLAILLTIITVVWAMITGAITFH
jgi:hypothetical protein